jgi:hypothetical protein
MSWGGFFRALTGETQPGMWMGASLITAAVFLVVWRYGSTEYAIAAATIVCLIVVPHSHPQDWVAMLPVAAMLLASAANAFMRGLTGGLLLAVLLGANDWPAAYENMQADGEAVFWVTPAAFALLVQLAFASVIESRGRSSINPEDRLVYRPSPQVVREA